MKQTKRLAAVLLVLALMVTMLPVTKMQAKAESQKIQVSVVFDTSAVTEDMPALEKEMRAAGLVDSKDSAMPKKVTVTVKQGATVDQALAAAQKKAGFTMEGLESGYVTKVGFVSNETVGKLTKIPVGDYNTGNIFSMAGWIFAINGKDLAETIQSAKLTENNSQITGTYHLVAQWSEAAGGMLYPDTDFVTAYKEAKKLTERKVDLTSFTDEEKASYEAAEKAASEAVTAAYEAGTLSTGLTKDKGQWVGLYEAQGEKLYGEGSVTEVLTKKAMELKAALAPQDKLDKETVEAVKNTKITAVTVKGTQKQMKVTWKKTGNQKLDGYEIYWSSKKTGSYKKLAAVTTAKWVTTSKVLKSGYIKIKGIAVINGTKVRTGFSSPKKVA